MEQTDVLVVVPKRDELVAVSEVFRFDPEQPEFDFGEGRGGWTTTVDDLHVSFMLAESQKAAELLSSTREALEAVSPGLAVCLGTAAGRDQRVRYLDTIIATSVLDITEWCSEEAGMEPRWSDPMHMTRECARDVEDFIRSRPKIENILAQFAYVASRENRIPRIVDGWVATTPFLHRQENFLRRIWDIQSRLKAVDMESSGFVQACTSGARKWPWIAIRTVSDYGTPETKRDDLRPAAGRVAGHVLRLLLAEGLKRSHPKASRASDSSHPVLGQENFFSAKNASSFFSRELNQEFGITLEPSVLLRELTLRDLAELCRGLGAKGEILHRLEKIRSRYYEQKYTAYRNEADIRSISGDAWVDEFLEVCNYLDVNIEECDILYVGVGSGSDIPAIFPKYKSLCGVDVAVDLLRHAKRSNPRMKIIEGAAESLAGIEDEAYDFYVSLRTFQSSFLDVRMAIRQAHRVLRPNGAFVVSIPAFFVDGTGPQTRVVPGLIIPGTSIVDPGLPRRIGERILRRLNNLAFTGIGFHLRDTEYYIYGRK